MTRTESPVVSAALTIDPSRKTFLRKNHESDWSSPSPGVADSRYAAPSLEGAAYLESFFLVGDPKII